MANNLQLLNQIIRVGASLGQNLKQIIPLHQLVNPPPLQTHKITMDHLAIPSSNWNNLIVCEKLFLVKMVGVE